MFTGNDLKCALVKHLRCSIQKVNFENASWRLSRNNSLSQTIQLMCKWTCVFIFSPTTSTKFQKFFEHRSINSLSWRKARSNFWYLSKQLSEALTLFCTSLPVEIENILPIKSILFYFLYGMPRTYND